MVIQLRDYSIISGSLGQFVDEWQQHLAPLRRSLGFGIEGAWTVVDEDRFVWLLSYPGSWADFEEADRRYFDSPERALISPDPARLIARQTNVRLVPLNS